MLNFQYTKIFTLWISFTSFPTSSSRPHKQEWIGMPKQLVCEK